MRPMERWQTEPYSNIPRPMGHYWSHKDVKPEPQTLKPALAGILQAPHPIFRHSILPWDACVTG